MGFGEKNPKVFRIAPGKFSWHTNLRFQGFDVSRIQGPGFRKANTAAFRGSLKRCNLEALKPAS
jgi:hypothetical protein